MPDGICQERLDDVPACDEYVLVLGDLSGYAQEVGQLLQADDDADAVGEARDDGPGDVVDVTADAGERQDEQDDASDQPEYRQCLHPVGGDDRQQHHRHRSGGTAHLEVGAAEDRSERAGDDCSDESRYRSGAGGDPERQGQRQSHHGHGEAGQKILTPAPEVVIVAAWQEATQGPKHSSFSGHCSKAPSLRIPRVWECSRLLSYSWKRPIAVTAARAGNAADVTCRSASTGWTNPEPDETGLSYK